MSQWHRDAELSLIKRLELAEESRARGFMTEPHLIRLMIGTLRWYADKSNYDDESSAAGEKVSLHQGPGLPMYAWMADYGERARVALAALELVWAVRNES